jgi:hypothetical protein
VARALDLDQLAATHTQTIGFLRVIEQSLDLGACRAFAAMNLARDPT